MRTLMLENIYPPIWRIPNFQSEIKLKVAKWEFDGAF
jgi:hypothetical protein